jgi:hypothetical protein
MANKTNPDLDKKMLSLTQVSIFIGLLGIIVGAIIGILQIRGGSATQPVREKTIIIREQTVSSPQTAAQETIQQGAQPATKPMAQTSAHKATTAASTAPETANPAKAEPQPTQSTAPPSGGTTPGNGGGTLTVPPLHRFPGGIHVFKPAPTSTSSTPVVNPGKFRLPTKVLRPVTPGNSGP